MNNLFEKNFFGIFSRQIKAKIDQPARPAQHLPHPFSAHVVQDFEQNIARFLD
jgi:hypothetical protein